jgi:hypothetical protein
MRCSIRHISSAENSSSPVSSFQSSSYRFWIRRTISWPCTLVLSAAGLEVEQLGEDVLAVAT